jgi:non-heme chloroperoxidase
VPFVTTIHPMEDRDMIDAPVQTRAASAIRHPGYIRTPDGANLFYRDWGVGQPLLFLSGWTLNSSMWAHQMQPLAETGSRCIAYDRRAHGRSNDPGGGYDFDTLADDLHCVIETLGLEGVIVVAHSFASGEVVRYLSRHGTYRIAGVVFVAPAAISFLLKTGDNPGGIDGATFEQLRMALIEDFPAWAESGAEAYYAGLASRAMINATIGMMNLTSHQAMLAMSTIQSMTDFRTELTRIMVPTLFIHGDCDASVSAELTSIPAAKLIPGAQLIIYEGGPHGLYFTHKRQLAGDIDRFVRSLGNRT